MNSTKLTLAVSLSLAYFFTACPLLEAKPDFSIRETQLKTRQSQLIARQASKPRKVTRRSRGASRTGCNIPQTTTNQELFALIPDNQETYSIGANPVLWFYLPYNAVTNPLTVRVTVQGETGVIPSYSKLFSLSGSPGIVGIRLPQALKQGVAYRWYFTIVCDANVDGGSLDGWMQSVRPSLEMNKKSLPLSQQLDLYRQNNIWHDRVTLLATQRGKNPQAEMEWQALLKELGMENLAQEPVLGIFKVQ
jgi:Domain of Unknown Function (DUF928)